MQFIKPITEIRFIEWLPKHDLYNALTQCDLCWTRDTNRKYKHNFPFVSANSFPLHDENTNSAIFYGEWRLEITQLKDNLRSTSNSFTVSKPQSHSPQNLLILSNFINNPLILCRYEHERFHSFKIYISIIK